MNPKLKTFIKSTLVTGLCLTATFMLVSRLRQGMATGEQGTQVWFFDESEAKLYSVPRNTIPPHEGTGGKSGDGVRAIVVACPEDAGNPDKRRIAYLETCTPELKQLQEDIRTAREAGRPYGKPIPSGESGFFEKNTLVRRPDETTWHDMTTSQAKTIVSQWRTWPCPGGCAPIICTP